MREENMKYISNFGFVALNENDDVADWFDTEEDAEEFADKFDYEVNSGFIVLDENDDVVDWFDTEEEAEDYADELNN